MEERAQRTILLVEDEVIIAMGEQQLLERGGYSVRTVSSGEAAVDLVRGDPRIDLVLMDIDLGAGMTGTAAAREILSIRELPVVFLTGHSEREYVDQVKRITRYGYVLKTAGEFVLLEALTTAFELFEAHRVLRESERRLKAAERLANLGGWELDLATGKTHWSDQFYRICGLEPGSVEPTTELGFSLIHPEDRERAREALAHCLETGQPYDIEKRIRWKDGTVRHVHSVGEVRTDESGTPATIIGSFLDITETVQARSESQRVQAQFSAFMGHLPGAAFLKDRNNKLLYCNGVFAAMVNSTPEKLMNTSSTEDLPPALRKQYERENRMVVDEQKVLTAESRFGEPGHETRWLTYKFPVEVENETLVGGISLQQDD